MASDREFIDLFVRLKGDFAKLEKLKSNGIKLSADLKIKKAGLDQLEKLKKGINVNVTLKIKGLEKLEALKKGLTIPVNLKINGSVTSAARRAANSLSRPTSQQEYAASKVAQFNAQAEAETKRRRIETDRQLKQLFEAQKFRITQDRQIQQAAQARRTNAKKEFESNQLSTVNRLEALAFSSTKNRRADTDRQLKQLFEAQAYKDKQRQSQAQAALKYSNLTAPRSDISQEANRQAAIDKYNRAIAPFSRIDQPKRDAEAARRRTEQLRRDQLRQFSEGENRRLAQEEFDLSPSFFNSGEQRRNIAFQRGLLPSDIRNTRRRFIDPRRIANKESVREIGFAGLFGGLPGLAGAVAGGAIGGPGGSFIGATVSEKIFEGLASTTERVIGVFEKLAESGLQFEESVLSISSSLQGFSQVTDASGKPLPVADQLSFQNNRARGIQTLARQRLLPIGIGGNKESGIVSGIISALAQKGITDFQDQDIADIAGLLGSGLQSQIPYLPDSRARLEVEDFFLQPGRNTLFNTATRAFTGDVEGATSIEEIKDALSGFAPVEEALVKNTENAQQAISLFNSKIQDIQATAGSEFIQSLIPAFQELTKQLSNPEVKSAIVDITKALGGLFAELIKRAAQLSGGGIPRLKETASEGGTFLSRLFLSGGSLFDYIPELPDRLGAAAVGQAFEGKSKANPKTTSSNPITASTLGAKSTPRARPIVSQLFEGLDELNPEEVLTRTGLIDLLSPLAQAEGGSKRVGRRNALKASEARLGALESIRSREASGFDTGTAFGQAGQSAFNLSSFDAQSKELSRQIGLRQTDIKDIQSKQGSGTLEQSITNVKKLTKATSELSKAEAQLTELRVKSTQEARKILDSVSSREQELLATTNQNTLVGQEQGLNIKGQALDSRAANLNRLKGRFSPDEFGRLQGELGRDREQLGFARQNQAISNAGVFNNAGKAVTDFGNLQTALNDTLKGYKLSLDDAKDAVKQNALSQRSAARALDELTSGARLRRLGEEGEKIALEEQNVAAGGVAGALELGVDPSLIQGSSSFNQDARNFFEQNVIFERRNQLLRRINSAPDEEADQAESIRLQQRGLSRSAQRSELDRRSAERNIEGFGFESIGSKLQGLTQLINFSQLLPAGSDIKKQVDESINGFDLKSLFGGSKSYEDFTNRVKSQGATKDGFGGIDQAVSGQKSGTINDVTKAIDAISRQIDSIINLLGQNQKEAPKLAEELKKGSKPQNVVPPSSDIFSQETQAPRVFGPQLPPDFVNRFDKQTGDYTKTPQGEELGELLGLDDMKGFAKGGRPPLKRPSIIGEKGPEIFVPDGAGTIYANSILKAISGTKNSRESTQYTDEYLNNRNSYDIFERNTGWMTGPGGNAVTPRAINTSTLASMGRQATPGGVAPQPNKDLSAALLNALGPVINAIQQQTRDVNAGNKANLNSTFAG